MENQDLLNILNNIDAINYIINTIKNSFSDTIKSYKPHHHGNSYSYFFTGHCNVFIKIMHNIFNENMKVFILSTKDNPLYEHVIAKIGENFYDINGYIPPDAPDIDKYEHIAYDLFLYYEEIGLIGNNDSLAKKIIPDLTMYGIMALNELIQNKKR